MLLKSKFRPAWWLGNPHAQTLWAAFVHAAPVPATRRERITTPDGDFLDLDWTLNKEGPVVILLHGLTGSADSRYMRATMSLLHKRGYRTVAMHFRGCSGEPNNTRGSYHSGHIIDIQFLIEHLAKRFEDTAIAAIGYSLGGNALLKYLATVPSNPLTFALSVSPPLNLTEGAKRMNRGLSRVYQWRLLRNLKQGLRLKDARYPQFELHKLEFEKTASFVEFDERVTAPLHGYYSAQHYYESASTLHDLVNIETPTHIIFAATDPFYTSACIPPHDAMLSEQVTFEITEKGGHVAFIEGRLPFAGRDWLRLRVAELLHRNLPQPLLQ